MDNNSTTALWDTSLAMRLGRRARCQDQRKVALPESMLSIAFARCLAVVQHAQHAQEAGIETT